MDKMDPQERKQIVNQIIAEVKYEIKLELKKEFGRHQLDQFENLIQMFIQQGKNFEMKNNKMIVKISVLYSFYNTHTSDSIGKNAFIKHMKASGHNRKKIYITSGRCWCFEIEPTTTN